MSEEVPKGLQRVIKGEWVESAKIKASLIAKTSDDYRMVIQNFSIKILKAVLFFTISGSESEVLIIPNE